VLENKGKGREEKMENIFLGILIGYLCIINIIGFCSMGVDKKKAEKGEWRIKEKSLFTIAAVGGSFGSIAGMQVFRHKTKHKSFVWGMPAIFLIQLILATYFMFFFNTNV